MAIAHDASSRSSTTFQGDDLDITWTHTPSGTPRGVVVMVGDELDSGTDDVAGVTYGGVAMTRVRMDVRASGESARNFIYFLGSSIPTGPQTVTVDWVGGVSDKLAYCSTVTAAADTLVDTSNSDAPGTANANPTLTLTFSGTLASWCGYLIFFSGLAAPVTTAETGTTHEFGNDLGAAVYHYARKAGSGGTSTTMGYTAAADDEMLSALIVKESAPPPSGAFIHRRYPARGLIYQ